ncbi:MAG TPA: hypothetical protein PLM76_11145, partial [Tenuifilaceae bacterium]|nr:hypothetical protein [Tenuifilaceae bacterium]
SLQKYESGIEYLNWSNLQVFYNDTTDVGTPGTSIGWELRVKAGTIGIMSDGGGNPPLALESIEIEPTITFGGTVTTINLTDSWQTIVEGNGNLSILENILISYRCGTDPDPIYSMLEKPPDYYFVDLEFKVFPRY